MRKIKRIGSGVDSDVEKSICGFFVDKFYGDLSFSELVEYHRITDLIGTIVTSSNISDRPEILELSNGKIHEYSELKRKKKGYTVRLPYIGGDSLSTGINYTDLSGIIDGSDLPGIVKQLIKQTFSSINAKKSNGKIIITDLGASIKGFIKYYNTHIGKILER